MRGWGGRRLGRDAAPDIRPCLIGVANSFGESVYAGGEWSGDIGLLVFISVGDGVARLADTLGASTARRVIVAAFEGSCTPRGNRFGWVDESRVSAQVRGRQAMLAPPRAFSCARNLVGQLGQRLLVWP